MDTLAKCWSSCLPRCTCRCLRRHRNRVGPSKPLAVTISKYISPTAPPSSPVHSKKNSKLNGETNLYFQGDELIFSSDITDSETHPNGDVASNTYPSLNGDCPRLNQESADSSREPEESGQDCNEFYDFLSTVFLQLSSSKKLRVIHIKCKPSDGDQAVQNPGDEVDCRSINSGSDEDEDYWFTKWSRRPKLKNTFKPRSSLVKDQDVIIRLNSRTTFSYKEIEELEEESQRSESSPSPEKDPTRIQRTCSSPTLSHHSYSPPPLPSSLAEDATKGIQSQSISETIPESNRTCVPKDNYEEYSIPRVESDFQQDLELKGQTVLQEKSAFTNFGFQVEPGDFELESANNNVKHPLENESKTENEILRGTGINHPTSSPASSLSSQNKSPSPEPVPKSNGFIRSVSSPSRMETLDAEETPVNGSETDPQTLNTTSKPLLFFIHGISGSSDIWKSQFKYFHDQGYEIVAPDLLGHGMSSTPDKAKHYLFESLVQDLVTVFDHFASETRDSVIIGHGYGACMGTVLSRLRSQNVSLLISVSGGGPTPLIPFGCLESPLLPFRLRLFSKKKSVGRFDNPDLEHMLPESIHQHMLNGQLWVDGDAAFHRRISVPTLLVYGMRDAVVSLIEECEMERTIPKAFLELLPSAGHMVMWDEPKKFNRMLIKFIQAWA